MDRAAPGEFTLEDLGIEDYPALLQLWIAADLPVRAAGRDAPEAFAAQMARGLQRVIGFRLGSKLVAATVLTHDGRKGWINRLAVDQNYRRLGLARRLVAEAERWFTQDLGLEVWAALIEGDNRTSLATFEALGFHRHDVAYVSRRVKPGA